MPARKLPGELARITGASLKNPARYKSRTADAAADAIGDPPEWLTAAQHESWIDITGSMPWLRQSHTGIVSITAVLAAKLRNGEAGTSAMNLLRLCLAQLGATPTDAHKIAMPEDGDNDDDLADEHFT